MQKWEKKVERRETGNSKRNGDPQLEVLDDVPIQFKKRIRKGRPICVQGYLREYRKDDSDSAYRAIVSNEFTTRKERERTSRGPDTGGTAAGYTEIDPSPDY